MLALVLPTLVSDDVLLLLLELVLTLELELEVLGAIPPFTFCVRLMFRTMFGGLSEDSECRNDVAVVR